MSKNEIDVYNKTTILLDHLKQAKENNTDSKDNCIPISDEKTWARIFECLFLFQKTNIPEVEESLSEELYVSIIGLLSVLVQDLYLMVSGQLAGNKEVANEPILKKRQNTLFQALEFYGPKLKKLKNYFAQQGKSHNKDLNSKSQSLYWKLARSYAKHKEVYQSARKKLELDDKASSMVKHNNQKQAMNKTKKKTPKRKKKKTVSKREPIRQQKKNTQQPRKKLTQVFRANGKKVVVVIGSNGEQEIKFGSGIELDRVVSKKQKFTKLSKVVHHTPEKLFKVTNSDCLHTTKQKQPDINSQKEFPQLLSTTQRKPNFKQNNNDSEQKIKLLSASSTQTTTTKVLNKLQQSEKNLPQPRVIECHFDYHPIFSKQKPLANPQELYPHDPKESINLFKVNMLTQWNTLNVGDEKLMTAMALSIDCLLSPIHDESDQWLKQISEVIQTLQRGDNKTTEFMGKIISAYFYAAETKYQLYHRSDNYAVDYFSYFCQKMLEIKSVTNVDYPKDILNPLNEYLSKLKTYLPVNVEQIHNQDRELGMSRFR